MKKSSFIFISYSSKDFQTAEYIKEQLKANGLDCWFAADDIPCGADYTQSIIDALTDKKCAAFLIVISEASQNSQHVRREIGIADDLKLPIYPVLLNMTAAQLNGTYRYLLTATQFYFAENLAELMGELTEKFGGQRFLETAIKYLDGAGVEKNLSEAAKYFEKAARAGVVVAQSDLGDMYYDGTGVEQSYERAVYWYKTAADANHSKSVYDLARCYRLGKGVPQDIEKAKELYKRAYELSRAEHNRMGMSLAMNALYDLGEEDF